jgi:hypothetical protein
VGPRAGLEFGDERNFASAGSRIATSGLSGSQLFNLWFNECNIILHLHVFSVTSLGPNYLTVNERFGVVSVELETATALSEFYHKDQQSCNRPG